MDLAACGIFVGSAMWYVMLPQRHPTTASEKTEEVDLKEVVANRLEKANADMIVVGDEQKEATSRMELLKKRHEKELEFEILEQERIGQKRQKLEATRDTLIKQRDALSKVPDLPVAPAAAAKAANAVRATPRTSARTGSA